MTSKGFFTILVTKLCFVGLGLCQDGFNDEFETCWERCFSEIDEHGATQIYREAYHDFYEMGMEARRLKNIWSVNGTSLLLDSTLSQWHDPATNQNLKEHQKGESIWKFQKNLAAITAMFICSDENRNPISIVQFNEHSSWSCDTHTCLSSCMAADILLDTNNTHLVPLQMNGTSHKEANLEPACRLGYTLLHTNANFRPTCTWTEVEREMAVAFVNSNVHSHVEKSNEWDGYSPCDEHFDTRYAIGSHAADFRELRDWSSKDADPKYIKDNQYTMDAAEHLVTCMKSRCCSTPTFSDQSFMCVRTMDHFGEVRISFFDHPETDY